MEESIDNNNIEAELPESVRVITLEGKTVYLVGTAHVSKDSVLDVRRTIDIVNPDSICVELCRSRYRNMTSTEDWKQMDLFRVVREKRSSLLLAQLLMSGFYKKIGSKLGVKPGAEMLEGVELARRNGIPLIPADRDIQVTLKRVWGHLGFWTKLKLIAEMLAGVMFSGEIDEELIEKIKERDQLESLMEEFSDKIPGVRERLIDERDTYLAQKVREAPGETVVAVVGAGHCRGIESKIHSDHDLRPLLEIPRKTMAPKVVAWGIPIVIVAMIASSFFRNGIEHSFESIWIWIAVNGAFSALGAALAMGHPITVVTAFIAAPITSLNPTIAAGWFAGLVQAVVRKPKVADIENLGSALTSFREFWTNPVIRILLVVVMANLGSTLGTFIGGVWIFNRTI